MTGDDDTPNDVSDENDVYNDPDFEAPDFVDPGAVRSVETTAPREEKPEPEKVKKPAAEKEEEPDDEEVEDEEDPDDDSEDTDEEEEGDEEDPENEDYDKPAAKKAAAKKSAAANPDEPFRAIKEGEDRREYQAKKEGYLRKQAVAKATVLQTTVQERDLEISRLTKERDELKQTAEISSAARADYRQDPAYKELYNEVMDGVRDDAELLGARNYGDPRVFGEFVNDLLEAKTKPHGPEYDAAMKALRRKITDKLGNFDVEYEEIPDEDRTAFENKVLGNLRKYAPNVQKLSKLASEIKEKGEKGISILNIRNYEAAHGKSKAAIELVGKLTDDLIDKNPNTVEAEVSRMVRDFPEEARRLDRVKKDVLEAFHGPAPLTEEDVKRLEANGTNVKQFEQERQKKFEASRISIMKDAALGRMARSRLATLLEELEELRAKDTDENSELQSVRRHGKKAAGKKQSSTPSTPNGDKRKRSPVLDKMGYFDD